MTSESFEIPAEGQESPVEPVEEAQAPIVEEPAPEAPQEFLPYRRPDGTEAQLPAAEAEAITRALGYDNAAALLNKLRMADESDQILREARSYYQKATRAPRPDADYQALEQRRQQGYGQPQYRPQSQPRQEDDPIQMLNSVVEETRQFREQFQGFLAQQEQRAQWEQAQRFQNLQRESQTEYTKFVTELKAQGIPEWKIPEKERLEDEAADMGLGHSGRSIGDIYRLAHRMQYPDAYTQANVNKIMERQRDPKAKIPVPASRPAAPPPPPKPGESINGLPWNEFMKNLPEGKF